MMHKIDGLRKLSFLGLLFCFIFIFQPTFWGESVKNLVDDLDNSGILNKPKSEPKEKEDDKEKEKANDVYEDDEMNIGGLKPTDEEVYSLNKHQFNFGIIMSHNDYYDNVTNNNLMLAYYRPFFQYRYKSNHEFYARGKFSVKYYKYPISTGSQKEYYGSMEVFSYTFRNLHHDLGIGRNYFRLGNGLILSNYADGVKYDFFSKYSNIKIITAYSGTYENGLCKLSIEGCSDETNSFYLLEDDLEGVNLKHLGYRILAGGQIDLPPASDANLSLVGLYSYDMVKEDKDSEQNYAYHPYYIGFLMEGFLETPAFSYSLEGYYQGGKTYSIDYESYDLLTGETTKISGKDPIQISAFALISEINILLPFGKSLIMPEVVFEYALGSGDNDRESVSDPINSNQRGKDTAFYSFGIYSGGLALKPSLANLHIYRVGMDFRPFYFYYPLRNLGIDTRYSQYVKHKKAGVISDQDASGSGRLVGHAFDVGVTLNFRSDLQFYFGYGLFQPKTAYTSDVRDLQHAYLINITMIF